MGVLFKPEAAVDEETAGGDGEFAASRTIMEE